MPHIHAIFPEDPNVRAFLLNNKTKIREALATATGYNLDEIALVPNPIKTDDLELADNVMQLEFVVNAGTKVTQNNVDMQAVRMKIFILDCPGAKEIHFGIWLKGHGINEFIEHKPT